MKRIFTFLLSALLCTVVFAQRPTGVVKKATEVVPKIDGVIDAAWTAANKYNIDKNFQLEKPTVGAVGTTYWKSLWNAEGMFVLVVVNDDVWFPNWAEGGGANSWEYDKLELYFDTNYTLADGVGGQTGTSGNRQIAPDPVKGEVNGELKTSDVRGYMVQYAYKVTGGAYVAEYFVPWDAIPDKDGILFDKTATMGFDVCVIDREPGDAARKRANWANVGAINENWGNMDDAGYITFDGADALTYVDVITLTAGTITTDNGKLQMTAAILPANATNKKLKWKLTNGTGTASISADGIVTAITNGTVKVKADAIDGGWAESNEVTITISGQVIDKNDIWNSMNLIQNWNFNGGKTGDWPTSWGGWHDSGGMAQPTAVPAIVDGVAVIKTGLSTDAAAWHYQLNQTGFKAEANVPYTLKFKSWATASAPCVVDFESTGSADLYSRYGTSTDANAVGGGSEWNYTVTTKPTWFTMNVVFDKMIETTGQKLQYMLSLSNETIYLDSVLLIKETDRLLSAKQLSNNNSLKVYPNPVGKGNILNVELASMNAKVAVFNSIGQKIMEKVSVGNIAKFDVSNLRKGMYFVRLEDGTTQKFIR